MERVIATLTMMMSLWSITIVDCWQSPDYGGLYNLETQTIELCRNEHDFMRHVLFHEIGHYMWFTHMTEEEHDERYALWLWYVTEYAETHTTEDFAEVFRVVVYDYWYWQYRTFDNENITKKYQFVVDILEKYNDNI